MKKKIFILFILLLLTGCKAKYNLKLNFGGNITESGTIYINSSLLGKGEYPSDYHDFLDKVVQDYKLNNIKQKLSFNNDTYFGYDFYKRYRNKDEYANYSSVINVLFNGLTITENDHYVTWNTGNSNKIANFHKPTADVQTVVETIEINISLPYQVVRHNATRVDQETNTYTWVLLSNNTNKGINLEYRDNVLFTNNPAFLLKFVSPYVYIAASLVLIILVAALIIRNKAQYRNRI